MKKILLTLALAIAALIAPAVALAQFLDAKTYGVVCDGATNTQAAIQKAMDVAMGSTIARTLVLPDGDCRIGSKLNITAAIKMIGHGPYRTKISWTSTTMDVLDIQTDARVDIQGINFSGPAGATAGSVIKVSGSGTQNLFSTFRDLAINQGFTHFNFIKAADYTIDNVYLSEYVTYGVLIDNTYDEDAGDSVITNSTLSSTQANSEAIHQVASGGLKIIGNKIIGGNYGYRGVIGATVQTSILIIKGNSIEGHTVAGISLERGGVGAQFSNVIIDGNQIAGQQFPITFATAASGWLSDCLVSSNVIDIRAAGGTGVTIAGCDNGIVSGNIFTSQGGTTFGVSAGVNATGIVIGSNQYNNITTNFEKGVGSFTIGPPPLIVAQEATTHTTANSAAEQVLATVTIPARTIGANGCLRISHSWTVQNTANAKNVRVRFGAVGSGTGATEFQNQNYANVASGSSQIAICNRALTNSQVGNAGSGLTTSFGGSGTALATGAIDTTAATDVVISCTKGTGGETCSLERYVVELMQQ